jgi:hypothetical protein
MSVIFTRLVSSVDTGADSRPLFGASHGLGGRRLGLAPLAVPSVLRPRAALVLFLSNIVLYHPNKLFRTFALYSMYLFSIIVFSTQLTCVD